MARAIEVYCEVNIDFVYSIAPETSQQITLKGLYEGGNSEIPASLLYPLGHIMAIYFFSTQKYLCHRNLLYLRFSILSEFVVAAFRPLPLDLPKRSYITLLVFSILSI